MKITLDRVWINDVRDTNNYITCFTEEPGFDEEDSVFNEVRNYAAGRRRSITRVGGQRSVQCQLKELTKRDVEWLRARRGKLVCLRDRTGRKVFGTYASIKPMEYKNMDAFSVSLTLSEVTFVEGVA